MLLFHHTPAATLISTTYTAYTHTTQIQDVGGTRVCSCSVVLSTFAVNSGYCGLNFIGLCSCDVIHILRADTLYDVANILTRVLLGCASPHLLSLVTAVNLELSATLSGCFHFFFLRIGVLLVADLNIAFKVRPAFSPKLHTFEQKRKFTFVLDSKFFELTLNKHI